jgi:hypothetical protein
MGTLSSVVAFVLILAGAGLKKEAGRRKEARVMAEVQRLGFV